MMPVKKLAKNHCDIWVVDLDTLMDRYDFYYAMLSTSERERAACFVRGQLTQRFVLSHGFMRRVLAAYLGLAPVEIDFSENAHGKPAISDAQSQGLAFNLSHSANKAVIAVTSCATVGVDIEAYDAAVDSLGLSQRFFAAAEHEQLLAAGDDRRIETFFKLWSVKEAFIKAVGLGMALPLKDFQVLDILSAPQISGASKYVSESSWPPYICSDIHQFSLAAVVQAEECGFSLNYFDDSSFFG